MHSDKKKEKLFIDKKNTLTILCYFRYVKSSDDVFRKNDDEKQ